MNNKKSEITDKLDITLVMESDSGDYLRLALNPKQISEIQDILGLKVYSFGNREYEVCVYDNDWHFTEPPIT